MTYGERAGLIVTGMGLGFMFGCMFSDAIGHKGSETKGACQQACRSPQFEVKNDTCWCVTERY